MHAHWTSLDNAGDSRAPARYGHSLTSIKAEGRVYLVCFGGTAADGITGQVNRKCRVAWCCCDLRTCCTYPFTSAIKHGSTRKLVLYLLAGQLYCVLVGVERLA